MTCAMLDPFATDIELSRDQGRHLADPSTHYAEISRFVTLPRSLPQDQQAQSRTQSSVQLINELGDFERAIHVRLVAENKDRNSRQFGAVQERPQLVLSSVDFLRVRRVDQETKSNQLERRPGMATNRMAVTPRQYRDHMVRNRAARPLDATSERGRTTHAALQPNELRQRGSISR